MRFLLPKVLLLVVLGFIQLSAQDSSKAKPIQIVPPNMVLVLGGNFEASPLKEGGDPRPVSVSSFYVEATEVTNKDYREFVSWMRTRHPNYPTSHLLPDTLIWKKYLFGVDGEHLCREYYRHPGFDYYPVVGVNWVQANMYCAWKGDRWNETLLMKAGLWNEDLASKYNFTTADYLEGKYVKDPVKLEAGILAKSYRLLTDIEWEYLSSIDKQSIAKIDDGIKDTKKEAKKHSGKNKVPDFYDHKLYALPKTVFDLDVNKLGFYGLKDGLREWVTVAQLDSTQRAFETDSIMQLGKSLAIPYALSPRFFNLYGKEIPLDDFTRFSRDLPGSLQIIEQDAEFNLHLKQLSAEEYAKLSEEEKAKQAFYLNMIRTKRILKGGSVADSPEDKLSNKSYSAPQLAAQPLSGFRCAMTAN